MMRRRRLSRWHGLAVLVTATMITALLPPATALALPSRTSCERRNNNTAARLLECVTVEGVERHLAQFEAIAAANDDPGAEGSRAALTKGYADSVDYVAGELEAAGYRVTFEQVQVVVQTVELEQLTPVGATYPSAAFGGSGLGEVTGAVVPVGLNLSEPQNSTSGCASADFEGLDFTGTEIALIQRGDCTFQDKVANAVAAGAEAVVIFNQGTPDDEGLIIGGLAAPAEVPVVGASFADGQALAVEGATAHVRVTNEYGTDRNVIADLPGRLRDNVVMAGAHLDSTSNGPGISDNGSGAAALLETALMMANHRPHNSVRFAFWAAEELGLQGSASHVMSRSPEELEQIALYLNYDMIASPNYVFGVYDGDESTGTAPIGLPIPAGSAAIEDLYEDYYASIGEQPKAMPLDGRSDYLFFLLSGIPVGGLFTGAEGVKSEAEAAIWGGTAGEPYDPCYHTPCDTRANIDRHALEVNSDLIAYAQLSFAYSTEAVNGVRGRPMPGDRRWLQLRLPSNDDLQARARAKLPTHADREDLLAHLPLHRTR